MPWRGAPVASAVALSLLVVMALQCNPDDPNALIGGPLACDATTKPPCKDVCGELSEPLCVDGEWFCDDPGVGGCRAGGGGVGAAPGGSGGAGGSGGSGGAGGAPGGAGGMGGAGGVGGAGGAGGGGTGGL